LILSVLLGLLWTTIVVPLAGGEPRDVLRPSWFLSGMLAGAAAGAYTIWSRRRRDGRERVADVFATYYVGMFVFWAGFVVIERIALSLSHGGWTDFNLRDHFVMLWWFVIQGTIVYGIALIPLCWLTRRMVWGVYERLASTPTLPERGG
jgi:hypothetical protein